MPEPLVLASGSHVRAELLRRAAVPFEVAAPRVDEDEIKLALTSESYHPRDIADALAEAKTRKVATGRPSLVLGCDQVLALDRKILSKPEERKDAVQHLKELRGRTHDLYSAAVIYDASLPVWRHVGRARLTMRDVSDGYIAEYVDRNWNSIRHSVGGYKIEEEGVRLFERIEGDYFNILGLPLLEVLSYLTLRGVLSS